MSDDEQQTAEEIDPDEWGDDPTGDLTYPPERPMGVDQPTQDGWVSDSVAERADHEEPELDGVGDEADDAGMRLVGPNDVEADDESDAIASSVEEQSDLSAEEAAVHPIDGP